MKAVKDDPRYAIAEKYCREQLTIMDGNLKAGMRRIGTEHFDEMVREAAKALPKISKYEPKRPPVAPQAPATAKGEK